jgi:hypothetical protein
MTQLTKVNNRVLVVYHYYEKDHSYIDNFSHFIRFAYQPDLDYLIVVAGSYSIELPRAENITYFFATNQNFDFGGYAQAIKALQFDTGYEHFIFVNSSVRGPFLPAYCKKMWIENLLDHFDQDVGIVGTVISLTPSHHAIAKLYHEKYGYLDRNRHILSHVQSTCYALPRSILCHLIATGFYETAHSLSKDETVRDYEIRLSQILLEQGCNLKCLLPEYNTFDYRFFDREINPFSREGDSGFEGSYFGRTVHPYEAIFIKTSRNTSSDAYLNQLAYSMSFHFPLNPDLTCTAAIEGYRQRCEVIALNATRSAVKKKSLWNSFNSKD